MSPDRLAAEQVRRYQAHLNLPGVGVAGQQRLLASSVLVLGVGGLGCAAAMYLAAAGVGEIELIDDDIVDATNLQRQVLYDDNDQGRAKVEAAAQRLRVMNPDVTVRQRQLRLTASNARELVGGHDVVIDGSDNFATRYVVNDACVLEKVPLVSGSLYQFEAQVTVMSPPATPCYRCMFPAPPAEQAACQELGVLGPLAGMVGTIQAAEALSVLLTGSSATMGNLLLIDAREMSFQQVRLRLDPDCPLCGAQPSIHEPTAVTVGGGVVD